MSLESLQREINQKENEILIGLEREICNLKKHIEQDDHLLDTKLKELAERDIIDKDLKLLQKQVINKTRRDLDLKEQHIWRNLEDQIQHLRNHIEHDDKLIVEQQKHIKEQQQLIESQCKVIQELVAIGRQQQAEMLRHMNRRLNNVNFNTA